MQQELCEAENVHKKHLQGLMKNFASIKEMVGFFPFEGTAMGHLKSMWGLSAHTKGLNPAL